MEAAFIPTMRVLFDAPITSPLNEIDVEDVGMFFVHLTREDMLQSHDANKKSVDILASSTTSVHDSLANLVSNEILSAPDAYQSKVLIKVLTSLQLTPNNYVHLRGLKVLSEQLLVTVKERTAVKQLEKLDKQLADWLAKDPTLRPKSPSVNKRRSEAALETEQLEETLVSGNNMTSSQSPSRKRRVLFSQSQGTLLDPDMVEEEARSGGEEMCNATIVNRTATVPSPVVPQQQDTSRRISSNNATFSGVMSSTRLSSGSGGDEAEVTVVVNPRSEKGAEESEDETEEVELTTAAPATKPGSKKFSPSEVVGPSDSEEEMVVSSKSKSKEVFEVASASSRDDDIFSDASGASQLSRVSLLPGDEDSTEESADDATPNPIPVAKRGRGGKKKEEVVEESTDEETTPLPATRRGGRSSRKAEEEVTPKPQSAAAKSRRGAKKDLATNGNQEDEDEVVLTPPSKSPQSTIKKGKGRRAAQEDEAASAAKTKASGGKASKTKKVAASSEEEEEEDVATPVVASKARGRAKKTSTAESSEDAEEEEEEEEANTTTTNKGRSRGKAASAVEVRRWLHVYANILAILHFVVTVMSVASSSKHLSPL